MPLRPPNQLSHERICAYGGAGMGKSYGFYTIMKRSVQTKAPAHFFLVDTDESVGRMLQDPAFACLVDGDGNPVENIHIYSVEDWDEITAALKDARAQIKARAAGLPNNYSPDWLCIDMLGSTYQWCQSKFTEEIFHKELTTYFLEARRAMKATDKKAQPFEGWKDWPVINGMYKDEIQNVILRWPGHVYVCNEAKALNREQAESDTKALYGPFGVVPDGQKRNPHLFQTVLLFSMPTQGSRRVTTVKDRSREDLVNVEIKDFAIDYLVKVGGWKLA